VYTTVTVFESREVFPVIEAAPMVEAGIRLRSVFKGDTKSAIASFGEARLSLTTGFIDVEETLIVSPAALPSARLPSRNNPAISKIARFTREEGRV
jgi:hypothetical protein